MRAFLCSPRPFPGATVLFWVHRGLEGPQQGNGKANAFPKCCPQAQRNFKRLWVGVLGIICLTKHKTDFSSCSYRACARSWAWNVGGSTSCRSACVGQMGGTSGRLSGGGVTVLQSQVTLLFCTSTFSSLKWESSCN